MERDAGRDTSGEHAAWRDLVSRLELEQPYFDPADAPWPDRENLRKSPAPPRSAGPSDIAGLPEPPGSNAPGTDQVRRNPPNRSRVIRPASFMGFSEQAPEPQASDAGQLTPGWDSPATAPQAEPTGHPPADMTDYLLSDDDDDRYIPPPAPPLPALDPVAKGAWMALFGGPGYLFIAILLNWQVPGWAELLAIAAFVTGFVVLVSRLGDGPSKRDGPDQGAVV